MKTYVPWPERPPKQFRGPSKAIAALATALYRLCAPLVSRFAGLIFIAAVVVTCLLVWGVAVVMQAAVAVQDALIASGQAAAGQWLSTEQLSQGAAAVGTSVPVWLLWAAQSLLVRDIVGVLGVLGFVSVLAVFLIWAERKVSGHMQSRLGPMRVGCWHGWAQSPADGLKLICKEDLIPDNADGALFRLAPYFTFVPVLVAFFVLPFGVSWVFRNLDVALLFILAMLGLEVLGVLMAGWASYNKWSLYGAMREACQVVSYEIPLGLSLLVPIMVAGSLRLAGEGSVTAYQQGGWFNWLAWHSPWTFVAMIVYFIASLASCKRAPFDLPEAESELVAGFLTEYSGFRWSLFFFAEYAAMFIVSGVLVIMFLGGWDAPWVSLAPASLATADDAGRRMLYGLLFSGPLWFIAKSMFLIYVQMWLRWTLPRIRIDQVLYACVQVMLPLILFVLLASVFWELALDRSSAFAGLAKVISVILGLVGIAVAIGMLCVAWAGFSRRATLPGPQAVLKPLRGG